MNMSQFNVPAVSLCESFPGGSVQPFLMNCGNHGNTTALSVYRQLNVTFQNRKHRAKTKGHEKVRCKRGTDICGCDFRSFFSPLSYFLFCAYCLFVFLQLWEVLRRVNAPSQSLRERAQLFQHHAFAVSPSPKSPGSEMSARFHRAVACKYIKTKESLCLFILYLNMCVFDCVNTFFLLCFISLSV